ncbi:MAG: hypothetical protein ACI8RD_012705, partial [Bacillariaceae sp.]
MFVFSTGIDIKGISIYYMLTNIIMALFSSHGNIRIVCIVNI